MDSIMLQISNILINPPGSLAFSLVLVFCVSSTLQVILLQLREVQYNHKSRLLMGLILIIVSQLVLFVATAFSWQVPSAGHLLLPPIDRTVSLFSLILIAWLWTYPNPHRLADISAIITSALILALGIFTYLFWVNQPASASFNVSQLDQIWNIISILLILILLVAIFIQKPASWMVGIYILLVHLAAYVFHYASSALSTDLADSVRLAQLLTYPCLPLLTQRLIVKPAAEILSWPMIPRPEDTYSPPPPVQPQIDPLEITGLKNQLELSNKALDETKALVINLQTEKEELMTRIPPHQPSVPLPQPIALPLPGDESTRSLAKKLILPLTNIKTNACLVKADGVGVLGALQRNFLNEAINLTEQAIALFSQLTSQPSGNLIIPDFSKRTELATGIDSAVASMNKSIRDKSITLRLDIPENPIYLATSQNILEQILIHLMQNAIQVTPAEETIRLEVAETMDETGKSIVLMQLTDMGGGVVSKNMSKILAANPPGNEPRFRGIGSLSSLHLAKTMVEAVGGKIWLESKAKQTTFFIQIPN